MSEMLDKWLAHYDPIHRGWTVRGIANGVCATNGFAFPRVSGGYNLYRGVNGAIDFDLPVGAAGAKAKSITTFSWRRHSGPAEYTYALRAIGGGGVESEASAPMVTVGFDAQGELEPLRPNGPVDLAVRAVANGRFEVSWAYERRGEAIAPATFSVFSDGGLGEMDWGTPVGSVAYRIRGGRYCFVSTGYAHDTEVQFGVRAVAANGASDGNETVVTARARAVGPAALEAVLIELRNA